MVGKGRSAASDNSKGRQDGKKQQRDAEARIKSDRQSARPVKGKDIEDAARGAECAAVGAVAAVIREKYPDMTINNNPSALSEPYVETYDETTIYTFNDEPARTVDDVVEVLNETIKRHI